MIRKSAFIAVAVILSLYAPLRAEIKPFTFVHISDTHVGSSGASEKLAATLADIDRHFADADFIILTGDVAEMGYEDEFTSYAAIARVNRKPIYAAPGNHDQRWSESGKENYKKYVGPTYQSFDHNGARFILMDTSLLLQHYAHFDGQQLERLRKDLDSLPAGMPAIIAVHHPPLSDGHYVDNECEFAELIRPYNVPLVLTGHGHGFKRYTFNNTTYAMGGSTMRASGGQPVYRAYKVDPGGIEFMVRTIAGDKTTTEPAIAAQKQADLMGGVHLADIDTSTANELRFRVEKPREMLITGVECEIDNYSTGTGRMLNDDTFSLDICGLSPGRHQLAAHIRDSSDVAHLRSLNFDTALAGKAPGIARAFSFNSGIESNPVVDGDTLFIGANDGKLRVIDLRSGKMLWENNLNAEVISTPAVTSATVIAGSPDSHVYCFDKRTGRRVWEFKTGQSVLASPLVDEGIVYIGSGDKNMYALDAQSGMKIWSFACGKHIKATPALSEGRLYFGAWDNTFYCLDAKTGTLVWKVPASTMNLFSAATCNPATTGSLVVFATHDYSVRALDQKTGAHIWLYKPRKNELGPSYSSPVFRGNIAYMGSISGHIVGHDMSTGEKVFDVNLRPEKPDPIFDSKPLIAGDKLYAGSVGGNLYCVDIPSKKVDWNVSLGTGFIFTSPALWNGHIILGSMDGNVWIVNTPGSGVIN
ncbi:MAG: PQQ-binding-like beta-propeller repeat protein [Candidatus Sumerlaeota bacterium]|nr:PQQ-binding-like beta-propeller repeat protein [Candidatus Sumerlaeota bacterium]